MDRSNQERFIYLFERVGEPLFFSPRGSGNSEILYSVQAAQISCPELADASRVTQEAFRGRGRMVAVASPTSAPDLSDVARLCPRSSLYNYFNPQHRRATQQLRELFLRQTSLDQLFSMACACRDSPMINCKLWINSFASSMLAHEQTRTFRMPAVWEIMPDQFFGSFTLRHAFRQAELPERDRNIIQIDNPITGKNNNVENRLAYFREDIGINSHHWHWHLVYRLEDPQQDQRRKGELFYYMHHAIIARYDAERLANGLPRVRPMSIDDNLELKEGYYGKLFDTNSGQTWGTRQDGTKLRDLNRVADPNLNPTSFRTVTLEQTRKWRDRIMEAIDTGMVIDRNNRRIPLTIDILGDMVEASQLSPNPKFYGEDGLHNVGHVLIAYSHDPEYKHFENSGPMGDTTTAMRDPVFYRWHKYIDIIFDAFKRNQTPYQLQGGDFPLVWRNVEVTSVEVRTTTFGTQPNRLQTFMMRSHVDLSRGLDFTRTDANRLGPIWLQFSHLNHEPYVFSIGVRNGTGVAVRATVRIFMAPRLNEFGERLTLDQQRKLFFEMDKFSETLNPGDNQISRNSTQSTVTVPWEQTFRDLERGMETPTAQQSICGCGWPQHMLLPRGNSTGHVFDLVVFLTNGNEDTVTGAGPLSSNQQGNNCKEALSFCGRLGQPYPDRKPMGYPFDRTMFSTGRTQQPVENLELYVGQISNMRATQVTIVHDTSSVRTRQDGAPSGRQMISGDPSVNLPPCPRGTSGTATSTNTSRRVPTPAPMETSPRRDGSQSPPPRRQQGSGSNSQPVWTSSSSTSSGGGRQRGYGGNQWNSGNHYHHHPSPPSSPTGWTRVSTSRPGSPNWGWGG